MKRTVLFVVTSVLLFGLGCGDSETSNNFGAVALPLTATGANGEVYKLSPARLRATGVTDPAFSQTFNVSEQSEFRVDLVPAQYQIELLSGWALTEGGTPIDDRVVLESPNPVPVDIEVRATTPITFVFGIGDTAIAFGNGQLAVDIDVNDRRGAGGVSGAGGSGGVGGVPECASDPDCEDGDLCTTDACSGDVCFSSPKSCSDGNACTVDSCDPGTGDCSNANVPNGIDCDFADDCEVGTICIPQAGSCVLGDCIQCGSNGSCSDLNACTTDTCSANRCSYVQRPNGTACSIGGTTGSCVFGTCRPVLVP